MSEFDVRVPSVEYDSDREGYCANYGFSGDLDIDEATILKLERVAERERRPLSPGLYEGLEPDALRLVFHPVPRTPPSSGEISFSIDDYEVTIHAHGVVDVGPQRRS